MVFSFPGKFRNQVVNYFLPTESARLVMKLVRVTARHSVDAEELPVSPPGDGEGEVCLCHHLNQAGAWVELEEFL